MSISYYNSEHYPDPTAYHALRNIQREEFRKAHPHRPLVYICSPFGGDEQNAESARRYCRFAVTQETIPLAPHLHYPQFMDDSDPVQRKTGLWFALVLLCKTDELWVFGERITAGMKREILQAHARGLPIKLFTSDCEVRTS